MQKKFVTNLALLLFLNLLIKPFWILGIDRAVQKAVGTEEYGEYFALFSFSFLLNIILDFGITNFNNKNIAQNNHLLTKHLSSLVVLKLLLAAGYIIITIACGLIIGYDLRLMKLLLILGFNQFLISFVLYLRSNLAGLHLFKTDSVISVLDRLIMISVCSVFLWGNITTQKLDVMWYVYTQTAAYALTAIITFIIVARKTDVFKLNWNFPFSLMILKKSFPFAILVLLMTFYNRIDTIMLERMLPAGKGAEQVGIYAQGYRLLDAANMIGFLFAGMLLPTFSRMLKYKEPIEQLTKLSFTLLITPALIVGMGCVFYQYDLMKIMYYDKNNIELSLVHIGESAPIFAILMFCFAAISTTYVFGTLLTANGNLKELNIMAASGMVLNITLNFILIPMYEAMGSAIASIITQFSMAFIQVLICKKKFHLKINYRLLVLLAVFIIGIIVINYISTQLPFYWIVNFGFMVIGCGLWAFISGLMSIKGMVRILKYG